METEQKEGQEKNEKKKRAGLLQVPLKKENFVVILLIGVLLLVITWPTGEKEEGEKIQSGLTDMTGTIIKDTEKTEQGVQENRQEYAATMEHTLEELLSTMEGAGKVKVMITLKDGGEKIVEKDITSQIQGDTKVDTQGSSQNISDKYELEETVFENAGDGMEIPYVRQVISPQVEGVVVCAQGGDNLQVKKNITEAIQALFGIEVHKIKIIKMSSKS